MCILLLICKTKILNIGYLVCSTHVHTFLPTFFSFSFSFNFFLVSFFFFSFLHLFFFPFFVVVVDFLHVFCFFVARIGLPPEYSDFLGPPIPAALLFFNDVF